MKNKPLLYALILLCLGIISSNQLDIHWPLIADKGLFLSGIILIFFFLCLYRHKGLQEERDKYSFFMIHRIQVVTIGILSLFIFLFGFFYTAQYNPGLLAKDTRHLLHYLDSSEKLPCTVTGVVCEPKQEFENKERIVIDVETLNTDDGKNPIKVKGKVRITIYNVRPAIRYNDRISVNTKLKAPIGFRNEEYFDYKNYLFRRGIFATGSVSKKSQIRVIPLQRRSGGVAGSIFCLREKLAKTADMSIPDKDSSALFKALFLGDRGWMSDEVERVLRRTGTTHLLAVSGLHLGFVLAFFLLLFKVIKKILPASCIERISYSAPYSRTTALLSLFPLCFYTVLTGMRLSTIRALIMISLYLLAFFFDRGRDHYSILAWAALIILLWKPLSLFEVDFQLTFLATLAVIYYIHHAPHFLEGHWLLNKGVSLFLVSSLVIGITCPLCILYFHYLSLGGVIFTPLAIPFLTLIIPIGLLATILLPLSQPFAKSLVFITGSSLNLFLKVLRFCSRVPWISFPLPSPPLTLVLLFYISVAVLACWLCFRRVLQRKVSYAVIMISCCIYAIIIYIYFPLRNTSDILEVNFMDVGKADAALISFPSGENLIIDGGGSYERSFDIGEKIITPFLWSKGVKRIRAVVVSHPHPDHLHGLMAVLRNFKVDEVWVAMPTRADIRYKEFAELLMQKGIRERVLSSGDRIKIGFLIDIICLHPPLSKVIPSPRGENSLINNQSLVLKICYGDMSILFTGDIEKEAERFLLRHVNKGVLASKVLKSPHHGSKNSNTLAFLRAVSPQVSIISSRQMSWYSLPAPSTIARFERLPTKVYRTDIDGLITLLSDGKGYKVTTWEERKRTPLLFRAVRAAHGSFGDKHRSLYPKPSPHKQKTSGFKVLLP